MSSTQNLVSIECFKLSQVIIHEFIAGPTARMQQFAFVAVAFVAVAFVAVTFVAVAFVAVTFVAVTFVAVAFVAVAVTAETMSP
jgi:hypothetical protein